MARCFAWAIASEQRDSKRSRLEQGGAGRGRVSSEAWCQGLGAWKGQDGEVQGSTVTGQNCKAELDMGVGRGSY